MGVLSLTGALIYVQFTEATVTGIVTDTSDQAVSTVSVAAVNESTGESGYSKTDGHGKYLLAVLAPGSYRLSVSVRGFELRTKKRSAQRRPEHRD